ncbi:MAG: type IX secretion system protein PorQ [Owenweeksia sp.]
MKKLLILLFIPFFGAHAQIGGSSTYQFLNLVPSARVAGQGSNAIANPESDLNFALYNPSLLNEEMSGQFTFSLIDHMSDILIGDVNYAYHFDNIGTFYLGTRYVDYGDFDRTNVIGVKEGVFTAQDYAFTAGYGYSLDSNWSFGANLKFINSIYDTYNSYGMSADLSATYQIPSKRIVIALVAKNMGYQFKPYNNERERLPFELQLGFSNRFEHLPLRWQITFEQLEQWDLRYDDPTKVTVNQFTGEVEDNYPSVWNNLLRHMVLGVEFSPTRSFNVQFGYNFRKRQELNLDTRRTSAGFSFGLGIKISKFRINYSRNLYHVAGSANHFSLITDLGDFRRKKDKDEQ